MERFLELLGKVITYAATAVLLILALGCEVLHFAGLKVIALIRLTVDTIREELSRRKELTSKGVTNVIITDFIEKNGCTEITLAALNARGEYVSDVKMKAFSSSGIQEGTKISLTV